LREPDFDVAIVGYGPTGAVLAGLLGLCGLRVVVLEREPAILDLPRAVHFDGEVMRVFQTLGVADEIESVSRVNAGMRFVDPGGRLILDWPRPQTVGPHGWYPSYRFHQPEMEAILRDQVQAVSDADVRLGWEVTGVRHDSDSVSLACRDADVAQSTVTARYAVGCDGGRSFTRGVVGPETEDLGFRERWLVVDALLHRDMPELGDFTIQHCHPTHAATYVRGPDNRRRWEIFIGDLPDDEAQAPEHIWRRLARWITPDDAVLERAAVYTFHSVIAKRWRNHRLLLAGDAAHQTPPFMGQGLCAGVRDAANLAWKLAACIHHGHDEALLESYQSERHPHVREYIDGAIRLGRLINASDPEAALKGAFAQPDGTYRMGSIAPRLGPGAWDEHSAGAGHLSPQPRMNGTPLDDMLGYSPVLLVEDTLLDGTVDINGELMRKGIPGFGAGNGGEIPEMLAGLGAGAVIVRPDRYVFGVAHTAGELVSLIRRAPLSPLSYSVRDVPT